MEAGEAACPETSTHRGLRDCSVTTQTNEPHLHVTFHINGTSVPKTGTFKTKRLGRTLTITSEQSEACIFLDSASRCDDSERHEAFI